MSSHADVDALVSFVVTSVVEHPDEVHIDSHEESGVTTFEVTVHPDDVGKVIGRQGRVIKALRVLARAAASMNGEDAAVEVVG
ncbi:MAG: KH domain-containing protein [Coriobacteriia bacterium]